MSHFVRKFVAALALPAALTFATVAYAQTSEPTEKDITDAWTYLYGRYLVIQQENHDINVEKVGYNKIKYNPLGSAQFVNPNLDVAYLEAWLAVDAEHAVIVNVPEIKGRYYTAEILNGWGEVIANLNERTFPDHPFGKFALVLKGSNPPIPEGAVKIELPAAKAKMLARVEIKGTPDEAVALQKQFTLEVPDGIKIDPPLTIPEFTPAAPITSAIFDQIPEILAADPDPMPKAPEYQALTEKVASFASSSNESRARVEEIVKSKAIPAFFELAKGFGTQKGGWSVAYVVGKFGNDIQARDIINYGGLWANEISEAIYFIGQTDDQKRPLDSSKTYEIKFPKDGKPDGLVDGFWSVTLYSVPDYRVVPNDKKRYNLNNVSGLKPNEDGSLSVWLAPTLPMDVPDSNWLPTPEGKGFSLNMRMYVPREDVRNGTWFPAPIIVKE